MSNSSGSYFEYSPIIDASGSMTLNQLDYSTSYSFRFSILEPDGVTQNLTAQTVITGDGTFLNLNHYYCF